MPTVSMGLGGPYGLFSTNAPGQAFTFRTFGAGKKGKSKGLRQIAALAVTFRQEHSFFPDS